MDSNFLYLNSVDPTKITCKIKKKFSKLTLSSKKKLAKSQNDDLQNNSKLASRNLDKDLLTDDESDNDAENLNKLLRSQTTKDSKESAQISTASPENSLFSEKLLVSDSDDTFCSIEEKNVKLDSEVLTASELIAEGQKPSSHSLNCISSSTKVSSIYIKSPTKLGSKKLLTCKSANESSEIVSTESLRKSGVKSTPEFCAIPTNERTSFNKSLIVISSTEASPCTNIRNDDTDNENIEEIIVLSDSDDESDLSIGKFQTHVSDIRSLDKTEVSNTLTTAKADVIQRFLRDVHAKQLGTDTNVETMLDSLHDKVSDLPQKQPHVRIASDDTQSMHESVFEKAVQLLTDVTNLKLIETKNKSTEIAANKILAEQDTESMEGSIDIKKDFKETGLETLDDNKSLHSSCSIPDESLTVAETSSETETLDKSLASKQCSESEVLSNQIQKSESYTNVKNSDIDHISDRIRNINISAKINIKIQISGQISTSTSEESENSESESKNSSQKLLPSNSKNNTSESIDGSKFPQSLQNNSPITKIITNEISKNEMVLIQPIIKEAALIPSKKTCEVTPLKSKTPQKNKISSSKLIYTDNDLGSPKPIDNPNPVENNDYLKTANDLLTKLYGDVWRTPDVIKTLKKQSNSGKKSVQNEFNDSDHDFSLFRSNIPVDLESTRLVQIFKPPLTRPETNSTMKSNPKSNIKKNTNSQTLSDRANDNEIKKGEVSKIATTRKGRQVKTRIQNKNVSDSDSEDVSDDSFCCRTSSDYSSNDESRVKTTRRKNTRVQKDKLIFLDLTKSEIQEVKCCDKSASADIDERLHKLLDSFKYEKPKVIATPLATKTKRKLFTPRFGSEDEELPVDSPRKPYLGSDDEDKENVKFNVPLPYNFELINKNLESVRTGQPIFKLSTPKSDLKKTNRDQCVTPSPKTKPSAAKTLMFSTNKTKSDITDQIDVMFKNKYGFLKSLDACVSKTFCHPDALFYRDNYRLKKVELAEKLYEIYNLKCFKNELNVPLVWNKKLLNTAGRCTNKKKGATRLSVVELSEKVLTSPDRLRCTLIHELCHAATWIFHGEHGHGATWKSWAIKANQTFPELPKIGVCHQYDIEYKYTYKCTLCGARSHAHSKSKKVNNIRCSYCHGSIEIFINKKDKKGNMVPTPVKSPKGFAKFVKEKYHVYKNPSLKHTDVMKLLSSAYSETNNLIRQTPK